MDSSRFLKASELEIFTAKPVKKVKKEVTVARGFFVLKFSSTKIMNVKFLHFEVKKKKPKKPKAVCLIQ